MKKQLLALAALVAVTGVALAAAPEGPKPEGPRKERRLEKAHLKEALGLTDAQVADLKKVRSEQQKKKIRQQADAKIARLELRDLLLAPTVDEKAVRAKAKQVADLQAAAANDRVEAMLALRKVVSAEQADKLMKMHQHRRQGHGQRRQLGHGPRGPRGPQGPGPARHPRGPRVGDAGDMDAADDEDAEEMPAL
jgi:Spy/CpxP family protein refolding chaperone